MKKSLLTELRNRHTTNFRFRAVAHKLSRLIAAEMAEEVTEEACEVETPIRSARGSCIREEVVIVSILRAGLAMLPAFMEMFELSRVGLLGIRRDEITALPHCYYSSLPELSSQDKIFLLDPMIATAGSSLYALDKLMDAGAAEEKIILVSLLATPEGVATLIERYPKVRLEVLAIDEKLNDKKFIDPGLGDFGDRFFGTT